MKLAHALVWLEGGLLLIAMAACGQRASTVAGPELADVVSVVATGEAGDYQFQVGIESPDQGCHQYTNWWEVVSEQGELLYRRILGHSHITEQPFVRSGGPVPVDPETIVVVRAHMHPGGYGGVAFRGSVVMGFEASELPEGFASELAEQAPLPQSCTN